MVCRYIFFLSVVFLASCNGNKNQPSLVLTNPSDFARQNEIVELSWDKLTSIYADLDTGKLKITDSASGAELTWQLEYKGKTSPQNLLILIDFLPEETKTILFNNAAPAVFANKTFGRYVPERKEDFAWENDKIAFRMYGKELENTPAEMANGVDVWVKRTSDLIIDKWYKQNDYHTDHGEGLDYYSVGRTLGGGDIAPFINDSIWFPLNYRNWKVLDNGPIRTRFVLGYDSWTAAGRGVNATKTITIDAGSFFNKASIVYNTDDAKPISIAAGLVKRALQPNATPSGGNVVLNSAEGFVAYEEPVNGENGYTSLALVSNETLDAVEKNGHYMLNFLAVSEKPVIYYFGATWNKSGDFGSFDAWVKYVEDFTRRIAQPILY